MVQRFILSSVQKSQSEKVTGVVGGESAGETGVTSSFVCKSEEPDSNTKLGSSSPVSGTVDKPVDLCTRKETDTEFPSQGKKSWSCVYIVQYIRYCLYV